MLIGLVKEKHKIVVSEEQAGMLVELLAGPAVKSTSSVEFKELVENVVSGTESTTFKRCLHRVDNEINNTQSRKRHRPKPPSPPPKVLDTPDGDSGTLTI